MDMDVSQNPTWGRPPGLRRAPWPGNPAIALVVTFVGSIQAATFGTAVPVAGGPLDIVLDERRGQIYLVDYNTNAVDVYSIPGRRFLPPIPVGSQPVSGAISPDGKFLYVTNHASSSLSIIDLAQNAVVRTVSISARPEGVAVGADGKVLITTLGLGAVFNPTDTLIVFNPDASGADQLSSVLLPPAPPTPPPLVPTPGKIYLSFRGRLQTTPDGNFIIGVNTPTNASSVVFVYEVASQQILRMRTAPGLSTVLSVSPNGSRFMAGLRMFDTATLNVLAQQDINNAPFTLPANFNLAQNVGGSAFSPDGSTLYSAFNVAPTVQPQPRPNSSTLLLNHPRNLGTRLGIQLPENILGKMVATSDGSTVYALSDSGFLILPVGQLNNFPILMPETTAVRLTSNQCDRSAATLALRVNNAGRGTLRYSAVAAAANTGLTVQQEGPQAPGNLRFTMNPATARRVGTTTTLVTLQSQEAINIPPAIWVYQNWLNAETRATTFPVEINGGVNPALANAPSAGLMDLVMDNTRGRLYIANMGKNQVEVFDVRTQEFLKPIDVGQYPTSMALGTDGKTLYVANSGGEWISMVDLDQGQEYDRISFPPYPFNANQAPITPRVIAQGIYGLQIFASTAANAPGNLWSSSGKVAVLRPQSNAIGTLNIPAPVNMVSTPGNESIMLLSGAGTAYLYDSMADDYILARTVMQTPITSYYGVVGAGPEGRYFLANRAILNSALVPVGGYAGGTTILTPQPPPGGGGPFPGPGGVIIILPPGGGVVQPGGGQPVPITPANLRNVSAVAPINATTYARFSTPQQANANAVPTGDPQPMIELLNVNTEQVLATAPVSEGPPMLVTGNQRGNLSGRWMAVDNRATTAYVITTSGLSIAPIAAGRPPDRITINQGGVVHGATFSASLGPSGLFSIFGQNMADTASAGSLPLPTLLGGACVTFNDTAVPLLMTSPDQINGQVPPSLRAGNYSVMVRSVQNAVASNTAQARVAASAPGVFVLNSDNEAALFHAEDFRPVTRDNPAHRDEVLILFATGIPAASGVPLQPGAAAPASPLVTTPPPKVFIGDPRIGEAEMIVEWSGFAPGFVGLNQINIRVHGDRIRGEKLPVSIQVGNVSSPITGPVVPVTYTR